MSYNKLKEALIHNIKLCKSYEDLNYVCSKGVDITYEKINEK